LNGRSILSPCPGGQTDSEALFSTTFSDSVTCRWFQYQESCAEAHLKDTLDNMPWIENESTDIAADSAAIILNCPQACEDCPSWLGPNECTDNEDISFPTRLINLNSIHSEIYIGCRWVRLFLESCAEDYVKDNLEALGYGSTDIAADSAAMRFYCPLACGDCSPSPSPNESGDFGQEEEEEEQSGCGECVTKFMAAGGCDDFDNDALIPPGCDAATCGEAAWEACGRPAAKTDVGAAIGVACSSWEGCSSVCCSDGVGKGCTSESGICCEHDGEGQATACAGCPSGWLAVGSLCYSASVTGETACTSTDCDDVENKCAVQGARLPSKEELQAWIGAGGSRSSTYGVTAKGAGGCGSKHWLSDGAGEYGCHDWTCCDHPNRYHVCVKAPEGDNIYGFEDVCVGLKSKKCKKQDTCEYKNKQCVSIDMPIDVCVGLKSKKCKKQDTCEYKNKQCVSIDGCGECVAKFMAAGGCDDFDNDALIPPGCDAATCGEAAWEACGRPGDNIYGFEDVCVGLKSKKCKKQDTCEYKNEQCVSIDMPIDVCVGLTSKKCKKQDTCEYKRKQKQCVMI